MSCGTCPDAVTATLRRKVQAELDKLTAITRLTSFFNDAFGETAGVGVSDVNAAVNSIPSPSPLNFLDILQYVTCPLTPLALGLDGITDLTTLDPAAQLAKVKDLGTGDIDTARGNYEKALNNSPNAKLISQSRKYEREMRRIQFNSDSFAEALVISATVQVVCGNEEFLAGPYQQFATLASTFSFTGGVPSTLDQNLAALIQKLSQGEAKFKALRGELF